MKKKLILALLAAVSAPLAAPVAAQQIAITGGRVITNEGAPLDGGTVLISGAQVVGVLPSGAAVPAGYAQVDARGKWVTPGIVAGFSQLGTADVAGEDIANDNSARLSPSNAALSLGVAYNPNELSIPITRANGVTTALVGPAPGRSLFAGKGFVLSLKAGETAPKKADAFHYLVYGERGAAIAGGSRPAAWAEIVNVLDEARRIVRGQPTPGRDQQRDLRFSTDDAEALVPVIRGTAPLMVRVDRASDIRQILKLPNLYPGLRLVLVSANEGWLVADEIARAKVPVITLGMQNRPDNFQYLGATMQNVGRMTAAGVRVGLGMMDLDPSFQPRNLPHYAGNQVAQGRLPGSVGLSWDQAFRSITLLPAQIMGLDAGALKAGAPADVVIWNGDPLELATQVEGLYIGGAAQSLANRQTELARRYLPGRDQTQLPEAYPQ